MKNNNDNVRISCIKIISSCHYFTASKNDVQSQLKLSRLSYIYIYIRDVIAEHGCVNRYRYTERERERERESHHPGLYSASNWMMTSNNCFSRLQQFTTATTTRSRSYKGQVKCVEFQGGRKSAEELLEKYDLVSISV